MNSVSNSNIDHIQTKEIKDFVLEALKTYGTEESIEKAEKVADTMIAMLIAKKQITSVNAPVWIDVMLAAAYTHNLFYDGSLPTIFIAREKLQPLLVKHKVPENAGIAMFTSIEAQLGDDMPVESCRPVSGTPNELFAWAVWFVNNYNFTKKNV